MIMTIESKNADVPMLYSNICKRPPNTERPATASLTPNEAAAPLLWVALGLDPLLVPDDGVPEVREVASAVVLQVKVPWMTLLTPASDENPLQSIDCSLWMLKLPLTMVSAGRAGVVKFPEKSMAPPTVDRALKLMPDKAVLLAIWSAPPTEERAGMEMFVNAALATNARLPVPSE